MALSASIASTSLCFRALACRAAKQARPCSLQQAKSFLPQLPLRFTHDCTQGHTSRRNDRLTAAFPNQSSAQPFSRHVPKRALLSPLCEPSRRTSEPLIACTAAAGTAVFGDGAIPFDDSVPFPPPNQSSLSNRVRAVLFYLATFVIACPLFLVMLILHPLMLLFDRTRRRMQHQVNNLWANSTTALFYPTEVIGAENLPSPDTPCVYVANHQSFLDIYTLFQLRRPFKFISKTSNFLIPIVGWSMFLTGHVPLKRMDKRSQMECLKTCLSMLQQGAPVLFFPEGTRTKDGKMAAFKKGAFSIAAKAGVPVVPITLVGTGALMPSGCEHTLAQNKTLQPLPAVQGDSNAADASTRGGVVRIVVHPPITGSDGDKLCEQARHVIATTLQQHGWGVA